MKRLIFFLGVIVSACTVCAQTDDGVLIAQDSRSLYISSPELESFVVVDKESAKMSFFNEKNSGLSYPVNSAKLIDGITAREGEAWFSVNGGSVFHYADGCIEPVANNLRSRQGSLTLDDADNFWACDGYSQIYMSDPLFKDIRTYDISQDNSIGSRIFDMSVDRKGRMWIACAAYGEGGVYSHLLCLSEGQFTSFPETLRESRIHSVDIDAEGNVWYYCKRNNEEGKTSWHLVKFDGNVFSDMLLPEGYEEKPCKIRFDEYNRLWLIPRTAEVACLENGECTLVEIPSPGYLYILSDVVFDGGKAYVIARGSVQSVNPDTGQADGYGLKHMRAILYTVSDGQAAMTPILPTPGGTTAVDEMLAKDVQEGPVFDLQGRKVDAIQHKGVYISNGKKVVR